MIKEKKEFIWTCVWNPFESIEVLSEIIDNSREIKKETFLKNCFIERVLKRQFDKYKFDYHFYKHKKIYFFTWSAIEHFYS